MLVDDHRARRIWTTLAPNHLLEVASERSSAPIYYYEFLAASRQYFFARYSADNLGYLCPEQWEAIVAYDANAKLYGWYDVDEVEVRFYEDEAKAHLRHVGRWRAAPHTTYYKGAEGETYAFPIPALEVDGLLYLPLGQEYPWQDSP